MMKSLTTPKKRKSPKDTRELEALFGLIRLYIQEGKPIGSETLRAKGFESLSSATLRNYFASLEEKGLLAQAHISGGRVPTQAAFRLFAQEALSSSYQAEFRKSPYFKKVSELSLMETKEVTLALQKMGLELSKMSGLAVCLSAPRFEGELIQDVKVLLLDEYRLMVVILTDFGGTYTEIIHSDIPLSSFSAKRIENYFRLRLFNLPKPEDLEKAEEELALAFYNETLLRYVISLTQFGETDLFKTGLARLLNYTEFRDHPESLCESLSLFEEKKSLRHLLHETAEREAIQIWIGDALSRFSISADTLAIIAAPYKIGGSIAGAFALLGPMRIPYEELLGLVDAFSTGISEMLSHNLYHFKIGVKTKHREPILLENTPLKLLENRRIP